MCESNRNATASVELPKRKSERARRRGAGEADEREREGGETHDKRGEMDEGTVGRMHLT